MLHGMHNGLVWMQEMVGRARLSKKPGPESDRWFAQPTWCEVRFGLAYVARRTSYRERLTRLQSKMGSAMLTKSNRSCSGRLVVGMFAQNIGLRTGRPGCGAGSNRERPAAN